jgi:hypothetical protein
MLIGGSQAGRFVPNKGMIENLQKSMDIRHADASVPSDRVRILKQVQDEVAGGHEALNRAAIGAVVMSRWAMDQPAVLAAAFGDDKPLAALQGEGVLEGALRACASAGLEAPMRTILARGVRVNSQDGEWGRTPLMLACEGGHAHCIPPLVEARADVNAKSDKSGTTSLHQASENGHVSCIVALLKAGASVDRLDGLPPTKSTQSYAGYEPEPVQFSHSMRATSLYRACYQGHLECVQALIQGKADVNAVSGPLHIMPTPESYQKNGWATQWQNFEPVAPGSHSGVTVLYGACRNGNAAIVTALLQAGAHGNTWMQFYGNNDGTLDVLGRGIGGTTYEESALDVAKKNGHQAVCKILRDGCG